MSFKSSEIFQIKTHEDFNRCALDIFHYQYAHCKIYKQYVDILKIEPSKVKTYLQIPFLPIGFFKNNIITTYRQEPLTYFESSGTTGDKSKHYYKSLSLYQESFKRCFKIFYGDIMKYAILALLPSYIENKNASLIYMVNHLINKSQNVYSGFYHNEHSKLAKVLNKIKEKKTPAILIGVSYALIDFSENFKINFPELIVMETGGMKGKRKEMLKEELHNKLSKSFGVKSIHSEYGMTELFSQAYSKKDGLFECPPWMKIIIRDMHDPLSITNNSSGPINVIDLANYRSCAFVATEDIGSLHPDNRFKILGRMENSQIRGCNLLVE